MTLTATTLSKLSYPAPQLAYTVPQFCGGFNLSRTHFYALLKEGKGPRLMKVGRRTLISASAAADWCRRMEDETAPWNADVCTDPAKVVA